MCYNHTSVIVTTLDLISNGIMAISITFTIVTGKQAPQDTNVAGVSSQHQQGNYAAAHTAATAALETQLHAAEQQAQELQTQLHHKDMRVANAEAAQRSAESERDVVAQEVVKLEEQVLKHQQVQTLACHVTSLQTSLEHFVNLSGHMM